MSEAGPPPVRNNRRKTRGRLTNAEMREINEYGIVVPSKKSANYEPNLNSHAVLWSSGTLAPKYNYRNKAKATQEKTWEAYLKQRANAEARGKGNGKSNTRKNNGNRNNRNRNNRNTRKSSLFGNFNIKNDPRITLGF